MAFHIVTFVHVFLDSIHSLHKVARPFESKNISPYHWSNRITQNKIPRNVSSRMHTLSPAIKRRWTKGELMLDHRMRHWPSIKSTISLKFHVSWIRFIDYDGSVTWSDYSISKPEGSNCLLEKVNSYYRLALEIISDRNT